MRIPCSQHVSLRLSGTERIHFKDCITLSLLDLSAWLLICNFLKSYYVLWSLKTVSKFCQKGFSGPDISPNSSLCTAHRILSNIWCRHASINTFNSIFTKSLKLNTCTNFHPEFDAVVSKTNARTWSARCHCCAMANMAFACSCGISD